MRTTSFLCENIIPGRRQKNLDSLHTGFLLVGVVSIAVGFAVFGLLFFKQTAMLLYETPKQGHSF